MAQVTMWAFVKDGASSFVVVSSTCLVHAAHPALVAGPGPESRPGFHDRARAAGLPDSSHDYVRSRSFVAAGFGIIASFPCRVSGSMFPKAGSLKSLQTRCELWKTCCMFSGRGLVARDNLQEAKELSSILIFTLLCWCLSPFFFFRILDHCAKRQKQCTVANYGSV